MQRHRFYVSLVFAGLLMLCLSSLTLAAQSPTPTATPSAHATNQPVMGIVKQDANLHNGPGVSYKRIGGVAAQEQVTIVGTNAAGDWYQLADGAWIAAFLVEKVTAVGPVTTAAKSTAVAPLGAPATRSGQPTSLARWKVTVTGTRRVQSINTAPNNQFQADPGYAIYLVELQWKNVITSPGKLTFDPQKVVILDDKGKAYPSIGGMPGAIPVSDLPSSNNFLLHAYHTGGSILITYHDYLNDTELALSATALDANTKQWTISVNGDTTGQLTMAFSVPEQAKLTALQWPGLPVFSLRPASAVPSPTSPPTVTAPARLSLTPTVTPKAVPATGSLSGKVFRSDTNAPIANAVIDLEDSTLDANNPKAHIAQATTDPKGHYTFPAVKPGRYYMTVTATFKQKTDLPCPGLAFTRAGWFTGVGTQKATGLWVMIAIGAAKDEFVIKAGDTLQKDIDVACTN